MRFATLALGLSLFCQNRTDAAVSTSRDTISANIRAKAVYLEFLGTGVIYSINYEWRFSRRQDGLGGRVGTELIGSAISRQMSFIAGINYIDGNGSQYFEVGMSLARNALFAMLSESNKGWFLVPELGWRVQSRSKGIFFRLAATPVITDGQIYPWGGLSFGYKF